MFNPFAAAFYDLQMGGPPSIINIYQTYEEGGSHKCITLINLHKWNDDKQFSFVVLEVFFLSSLLYILYFFPVIISSAVVVSDRWMLTAKRSMNRMVCYWCVVILLDIGNELWFQFYELLLFFFCWSSVFLIIQQQHTQQRFARCFPIILKQK